MDASAGGALENVSIEMLVLDLSRDGNQESVVVRRLTLFVLGNATMQMRARGVVETSSGEVRVFNIRHAHNPDEHGEFFTIGSPMPGSYEENRDGLRDFERHWLTEEFAYVPNGSPMPEEIAAYLG